MQKLEKSGSSGTSKSLSLLDKLDLQEAQREKKHSKKKPQLEIVCDGDSWVFGCEILDPVLAEKMRADEHPGAYDFEAANDAYRIPKIFSTHLAELLDAKVTNLSWPADDNGSILRRTIEYVTAEYLTTGRSTENLMVIVGWSSPERNSFWYRDNKLSQPFRLLPQVQHFDTPAQKKFWELYVTYLWNPEEYMTRYVFNVLQLQNFCNQHGIKWLCFNSFYQTPKQSVSNWHDLDIRAELTALTGRTAGYQYQHSTAPLKRQGRVNQYVNIWDTIDPVRFYQKDQPSSTFKSYVEDPVNRVDPVFCGWHPSPESHTAWAAELVRYINEHSLLT